MCEHSVATHRDNGSFNSCNPACSGVCHMAYTHYGNSTCDTVKHQGLQSLEVDTLQWTHHAITPVRGHSHFPSQFVINKDQTSWLCFYGDETRGGPPLGLRGSWQKPWQLDTQRSIGHDKPIPYRVSAASKIHKPCPIDLQGHSRSKIWFES